MTAILKQQTLNLAIPNFSQFVNFSQFLGPNCPKSTLGWSIKTNAT